MARSTREARTPPRRGTADKSPPARKRTQLNVIVSAKTKTLIERLAQESGGSQGQVAEALIERAIIYDNIIAAMNRTLESIQRGHVEEAFRSDGYVPKKTPYGQIWLPPQHPLAHGGSLVEPWAGEELKVGPAAGRKIGKPSLDEEPPR